MAIAKATRPERALHPTTIHTEMGNSGRQYRSEQDFA
jgi:hypothetical protein